MSRSAAVFVKAGAAIAVLAAVVLAGHVLHLEYDSRLQVEWTNVGHLPVFAALCGLIWWMIPADLVSGWRRLAAAFAIAGVIGVLGEFVQIFGSRNADPYDVLRDLAGAGIACLLIAAWPPARTRRIAALAAALVLAAIACLPLVYWINVIRQREAQLPQLAPFDSDWELQLWKVNRARLGLAEPPPEWSAANGRVAKLELEPAEYPGISFQEIHPDWTGYEALVIDFYNAGSPIEFTVRVHDRAHDQRFADRFNTSVLLKSGPTLLRLPLAQIHGAPEGRKMDMTRIQGLVMSAYRLKRPATVYVEGIRLQ